MATTKPTIKGGIEDQTTKIASGSEVEIDVREDAPTIDQTTTIPQFIMLIDPSTGQRVFVPAAHILYSLPQHQNYNPNSNSLTSPQNLSSPNTSPLHKEFLPEKKEISKTHFKIPRTSRRYITRKKCCVRSQLFH